MTRLEKVLYPEGPAPRVGGAARPVAPVEILAKPGSVNLRKAEISMRESLFRRILMMSTCDRGYSAGLLP